MEANIKKIQNAESLTSFDFDNTELNGKVSVPNKVNDSRATELYTEEPLFTN